MDRKYSHISEWDKNYWEWQIYKWGNRKECVRQGNPGKQKAGILSWTLRCIDVEKETKRMKEREWGRTLDYFLTWKDSDLVSNSALWNYGQHYIVFIFNFIEVEFTYNKCTYFKCTVRFVW